jgi:glutathione S-transferase
MLTLYHSPTSRSSSIVTLIDELGAQDHVQVRTVTIPRMDGTGARDPANPHPEGKVPYLVHDGHGFSERGAIILYLTDMFPDAGLGPLPGDPLRGEYLSWLSWYQGVMEPVLIFAYAQLAHPVLDRTFRGVPEMTARLSAALKDQPYLLGDRFSGADLLLHSPYVWFPDAIPADPNIRDWVARCADRPAKWRTKERDDGMMAQAA